jgi:hypothetical protein
MGRLDMCYTFEHAELPHYCNVVFHAQQSTRPARRNYLWREARLFELWRLWDGGSAKSIPQPLRREFRGANGGLDMRVVSQLAPPVRRAPGRAA